MSDKQLAQLTAEVWLVGSILAVGLDAAEWAQLLIIALSTLTWFVYGLTALRDHLVKREEVA